LSIAWVLGPRTAAGTDGILGGPQQPAWAMVGAAAKAAAQKAIWRRIFIRTS